MKTIILSFIFIPFIAFSQSKDLSKNEAYTAFKNSNIRKELGFKLKDFNYQKLIKKAEFHKVNLSSMNVLNSTKDKQKLSLLYEDYIRKDNKGAKICQYCSEIPYGDIKGNYQELEPEKY